ncbi:hypothetical protein C2S51_031350 [Perilla frutescens var. frutescens]|nr:hypothetical protein C2S51_031350 [Perilla frutescens var. frutescens]
MSPRIDMDELFDLDLALTTTEEENDETNDHQSDDTQATAVDEIPTVIMGGGGGRGCIVCMEEFEVGGAAKQVPCDHVFHENCISKWLSIHNSCPLCRRIIIST